MLQSGELQMLESRAAKARITMAELCDLAEVSYTTWWRASKRGAITIRALRRLEGALDQFNASKETNNG